MPRKEQSLKESLEKYSTTETALLKLIIKQGKLQKKLSDKKAEIAQKKDTPSQKGSSIFKKSTSKEQSTKDANKIETKIKSLEKQITEARSQVQALGTSLQEKYQKATDSAKAEVNKIIEGRHAKKKKAFEEILVKISNSEDLSNILARIGQDSKGIKTDQYFRIGLSLTKLIPQALDIAANSSYYEREIVKLQEVASGRMSPTPLSPPFFSKILLDDKLIEDKSLLEYLAANTKLQGIITSLVPNILPDIITRLADAQEIEKVKIELQKRKNSLTEKNKELESLQTQLKTADKNTKSRLEERINELQEEIKPIISLRNRVIALETISSLKTNINASNIESITTPIIKSVVDLLKIQNAQKIAKDGISILTQGRKEVQSPEIESLLSSLPVANIIKILSEGTSDLLLGNSEIITKSAEAITTSFASQGIIPTNLTKNFTKDIVEFTKNLVGSVLKPDNQASLETIVTNIIPLLTSESIDNLTDFKQAEKLDDKALGHILTIVSSVISLLKQKETLPIFTQRLPELLEKHQDSITAIVDRFIGNALDKSIVENTMISIKNLLGNSTTQENLPNILSDVVSLLQSINQDKGKIPKNIQSLLSSILPLLKDQEIVRTLHTYLNKTLQDQNVQKLITTLIDNIIQNNDTIIIALWRNGFDTKAKRQEIKSLLQEINQNITPSLLSTISPMVKDILVTITKIQNNSDVNFTSEITRIITNILDNKDFIKNLNALVSSLKDAELKILSLASKILEAQKLFSPNTIQSIQNSKIFSLLADLIQNSKFFEGIKSLVNAIQSKDPKNIISTTINIIDIIQPTLVQILKDKALISIITDPKIIEKLLKAPLLKALQHNELKNLITSTLELITKLIEISPNIYQGKARNLAQAILGSQASKQLKAQDLKNISHKAIALLSTLEIKNFITGPLQQYIMSNKAHFNKIINHALSFTAIGQVMKLNNVPEFIGNNLKTITSSIKLFNEGKTFAAIATLIPVIFKKETLKIIGSFIKAAIKLSYYEGKANKKAAETLTNTIEEINKDKQERTKPESLSQKLREILNNEQATKQDNISKLSTFKVKTQQLKDLKLVKKDITSVKIDKFKFIGSTIDSCRFESQSTLENNHFLRGNLKSCSFGENTQISKCTFEQIAISGCYFKGGIKDCSFKNCKLNNIDFSSTKFSGNITIESCSIDADTLRTLLPQLQKHQGTIVIKNIKITDDKKLSTNERNLLTSLSTPKGGQAQTPSV